MGDSKSIPALVEKLRVSGDDYWWQLGRYVWSKELTQALDDEFTRQQAEGPGRSRRGGSDWLLSELLIRLPVPDAEKMLVDHWQSLSSSGRYVLAALYIATPRLCALAASAIGASSEPAALLRFLSSRFGHRHTGHPGITRQSQIEAVVPFLDLLEQSDIMDLWEACNQHGWYTLRREHLDARLDPGYNEWRYLHDDRFLALLDEQREKDERWLDHRLETMVESGRSKEEIMMLVRAWLARHGDIEALKVACAAVVSIGTRRDIEILKALPFNPAHIAREMIANTEFTVNRRSLS